MSAITRLEFKNFDLHVGLADDLALECSCERDRD